MATSTTSVIWWKSCTIAWASRRLLRSSSMMSTMLTWSSPSASMRT